MSMTSKKESKTAEVTALKAIPNNERKDWISSMCLYNGVN